MNNTTEEVQVYGGRLGRTSKTSVLISSHAGPVFPASVYTSINVTQDPNLLDALDVGSLNQISSPFDSHVYSLSIPVRYHDEDRKIFALIIPESLRHEEFKHRSELLQELAKEREILPDYVRQFHTVFSYAQLQDVIKELEEVESEEESEDGLVEKTETFGLGSSMGLEESSSTLRPPPAHDAELLQKKEEVEQERMELSQMRAELELQQTQLQEVSDRLERERERMEEIEMNISTERSEVELARQELTQMRDSLLIEKQQLEALRLNLEQRQRDIDAGVPKPEVEEKTQVVTDDQFVEILASDVDGDDDADRVLDEGEILAEESFSDDIMTSAPLHAETALVDPLPADDFDDEATQITQVPSLDHVNIKAEFDPSRAGAQAGAQDHYIGLVDGAVVASLRGSRKRIDELLDAEPQLFVQYATIESFPVAVLLLASLEDQQLVDSFAWLLDLSHASDRQVLEALAQDCAVRFAFYNRQNKLLRTYDIKAPLEHNAQWVMHKVESSIQDANMGGFSKASEVYFADGYERLGTMRHSFTHESFSTITTPEQAKLAAGIVGYWSTPDVYEYLVGNRSFPLSIFKAIQRRVVEAALKQGIYLNKPLRQVALDAHLVDHERALARRLMANFAEVSIGLKPSELDPLEIWENWDALLALADEVGAQPEADVVELAQASLRKAKEFQEDPQVHEQTQIMTKPVVPEPISEPKAEVPKAMALKLPQLKASVEVEELVVAKRSENTGVTYFLPDDAVLDQFDDMESMSKDDLLLLLDDHNGRLEAAQMLLERFGDAVLHEVLEASEEMLAAEVVGLAKFVESRADSMETALVKGVEEGGASSTYIGTYALAGIRSTSALPVLLDALQDTRRSGNRKALSEALARYEDKLYPALINVIKRHGHNDALLDALVSLEARQPDTLGKALKHRHRRVRDAAKAARKRLS